MMMMMTMMMISMMMMMMRIMMIVYISIPVYYQQWSLLGCGEVGWAEMDI
jgi:hypothetical protein